MQTIAAQKEIAMREVKFRAWVYDKAGDKFNMYYSDQEKEGLKDFFNWLWPLRPDGLDVLMQSTGKKDKNGAEIYDGDIYKDADGIISIVKMAVDGWALFPVKKGIPVRNLYWHNVCDKTKGEIIGDIHTTPEKMEAPDEGK